MDHNIGIHTSLSETPSRS